MKYFVGIDGGGSKTEFVVADQDLRPIKQIRINKGTNPWNCGIDQSLQVLREGLAQLEEFRADAAYCVAGISGCMGTGRYKDQITEVVRSFCPRADVEGDLVTAFWAGSTEPSGIIAVAGSGSSAAQFFADGSFYVYDAAIIGGRDLGFLLARAYERGTLEGVAGRRFIERYAPSFKELNPTKTHEYYHNDELRHLAGHIAQLPEESAEFQDLQVWIDVAVDRWRFKLYGIVDKFLQKQPQPTVTVVLNGTLWQFQYVRQQVTGALQADFANIHIVYDAGAQPVVGALRLAKSRSSH